MRELRPLQGAISSSSSHSTSVRVPPQVPV